MVGDDSVGSRVCVGGCCSLTFAFHSLEPFRTRALKSVICQRTFSVILTRVGKAPVFFCAEYKHNTDKQQRMYY